VGGVKRAAVRRPPDKASQILQAAREEFLKHGYGAASMDGVALAAGVSKPTLYVYFGSKRDLFEAIIREEPERYGVLMLSGGSGRATMLSKLLRFGRSIVDFLLSPETVASYRMVVAEAGRLPELGEIFYANGPVKFLDRLEQFVAQSMKSGALRSDNPRTAAEHLIGLVRGDLQLCVLLGLNVRLTPKRIDDVVRSGVDAFYRAYRPDVDRPGMQRPRLIKDTAP
jgi:AcrR family transcriptional regulator